MTEQFLISARYIDREITNKCDRTEIRYQKPRLSKKTFRHLKKQRYRTALINGNNSAYNEHRLNETVKRLWECEVVMDIFCQDVAMTCFLEFEVENPGKLTGET